MKYTYLYSILFKTTENTVRVLQKTRTKYVLKCTLCELFEKTCLIFTMSFLLYLSAHVHWKQKIGARGKDKKIINIHLFFL